MKKRPEKKLPQRQRMRQPTQAAANGVPGAAEPFPALTPKMLEILEEMLESLPGGRLAFFADHKRR